MVRWLKPIVFLACLGPLARLGWKAYMGELGANPVEVITHSVLDKFVNMHEIWADVLKRRFITVGFTGFVLLIPLALTSTQGWIRRLGGSRWQALHRLIYLSAIAGVVHYWWLVKADISKPGQYAFVLSLLLGYRLVVWMLRRIGGKAASVSTPSAKVAEG